MKNVIVLLIVLVGVSSCNMIRDIHYGDQFSGKTIYTNDEIESISPNLFEIFNFLNDNIEYIKHDSNARNLDEAMLVGGDCKEYCVGFSNIWFILTGEKCEIILVQSGEMKSIDCDFIGYLNTGIIWEDIESNTGRTIEKGGSVNHALVRLPNGQIVDPTNSIPNVQVPVRFSYSFGHVF